MQNRVVSEQARDALVGSILHVGVEVLLRRIVTEVTLAVITATVTA